MKRKGNLSEELYKMRKLISYDSKEDRETVTSLDRLVEEAIRKNFLKEQDSSVEVSQSGKGKKSDNPDRLFDEEYYKPSTGIQKKNKRIKP